MSDGATKKIIVNLDSLQSTSAKKQTKKRVPSHVVPNKLKDTFMRQVQHYKSQKRTTPAAAAPPTSYTSDFNASVEYLTNLKKSSENVHTELPEELLEFDMLPTTIEPKLISDTTGPIKCNNNSEGNTLFSNPPLVEPIKQVQEPFKYTVDNAVPYGCLKNGVKPCFKKWTRSNRTTQSEPILQETTRFSEPTRPETTKPEPPKPIKPIEQRTIIKRHVIGKSKKTKQVGVLIKNINTRKQIMNAYKDLKKVNINTVKTHLKNNGLLKVGTTAPIDVIRQTYESSILAGDIINKNEGTLYHNFINDNDSSK